MKLYSREFSNSANYLQYLCSNTSTLPTIIIKINVLCCVHHYANKYRLRAFLQSANIMNK